MKPSKKFAKKISIFLIIAVIVISMTGLAGCSSSSKEPDSAPDTASGKTTKDPNEWPNKPITCVIGYAAGGTSDIVGRVLIKEMEEYLGVPITPVNIAGASAAIAGRTVIDAPADGYTWLSAVAHSASSWAVMGYEKLFWTDYYGFTTGTSPYLVVVDNDAKWNTIEELIADIKANPNKLKWGSAGLGSIGHLAGELFVQALDLKTPHIGYNGGREAVLKLMGGDVDWNLSGYSDIADLVKAGEVKALGFVTEEDVLVETATPYTAPSLLKKYPELERTNQLRSVWGLFIPRETPDEIVKKIGEAVDYALKQPDFIEALEARELTPLALKGQESDELCARLESIYAWGLYDSNSAKNSPADYGIPRIEDFSWPPHERAQKARPWPTM